MRPSEPSLPPSLPPILLSNLLGFIGMGLGPQAGGARHEGQGGAAQGLLREVRARVSSGFYCGSGGMVPNHNSLSLTHKRSADI